jgi:AraC family transcriptional regulator, regulatory protein of adaptative response / methylated-DNA-[protein]-cysteine methyltransferase
MRWLVAQPMTAPENRWPATNLPFYNSTMIKLPPTVEMERAYLNRDPAYNGLFFVGVRTTAIFCRPTCPARSPLPKNVEYFPTAASALFAGYRPCKRCRPMAIRNQPEWAEHLIEDVERDPASRITERDLRRRGVDPATVRRHFLRHYGMTFQAYTRSRRLSRAFNSIRDGAALDDVILASGYDSHSGFRDAFVQMLGCTPGKSSNRDCVLLAWIETPLGPMIAGATDDGVCLLEFTDRRMLEAQFETVRRRFGGPAVLGSNAHLERLQDELARYFAGTVGEFSVPLVYPGTPFQRLVWEKLLEVPYGETRSYQDLALAVGNPAAVRAVGNPAAVRAVGRANGMNRIAILIPCHRIVNKNGDLGGYGGGLRRKQYLLNLEHVAAATREDS